ncbi:MAG: hypothetical protein EAZ92_05800 [Candidatus Kapaibacterium sp.]|nr:MAG: hypothetical protein EAZ92_05800 [Candidatus Kapabacteria bacterium]
MKAETWKWAVIFCAIVLHCGIPLFAQERTATALPKRNLEILDSLISKNIALQIIKQLRSPLFPAYLIQQVSDSSAVRDTLRLRSNSHEAAWMLEQALFSQLPRKKRYRMSDSATPHYCLHLRMEEAATRYATCQSNVDLLQREISCTVHAHLETKYGTIQELQSLSEISRDTISRRFVANLENKQYAFTQANVPEVPPNFWKQVVEPALVIAAAGIMVALFFFVRTQ